MSKVLTPEVKVISAFKEIIDAIDKHQMIVELLIERYKLKKTVKFLEKLNLQSFNNFIIANEGRPFDELKREIMDVQEGLNIRSVSDATKTKTIINAGDFAEIRRYINSLMEADNDEARATKAYYDD